MAKDFLQALGDQTVATLLSPASLLSIWSLLGAVTIAVAVALIKRRGRAVPARVLVRAMFPRRRLTSRSARLDLGFTLFSVFGSSLLLGWAVLSHVVLSEAVATSLRAGFGMPVLRLPDAFGVALITIALWLAYEFAYFLNHWLSHRWAVLWAFHKVHHSAESLSPLTIFRVHPIDSIAFYNMVAIVTGLTAGMMRYALGDATHPLTIAGTNVLMVGAILTIKHLQHSHAWIAFTGNWGRVFLSPAHHQIHHSIAPEHHDRNFGGTIAVFDWLAGTLCIPDAKRQPLVFGVDDLPDPHTFAGSVLAPFRHAGDALGLPRGAGRHPAVTLEL